MLKILYATPLNTAETNVTVLLVQDYDGENGNLLMDKLFKKLEPMKARYGVLTLGTKCPMEARKIEQITSINEYRRHWNLNFKDSKCTINDISIFSYEPIVRQTRYSLSGI